MCQVRDGVKIVKQFEAAIEIRDSARRRVNTSGAATTRNW
jgi:hypothetical protein